LISSTAYCSKKYNNSPLDPANVYVLTVGKTFLELKKILKIK
jgi:hypothetical protein